MKQLVRATAVAISVGIGVIAFGGVAHAWYETASAQSGCVGGATSITVTFTNTEPTTGDHAMVVSATDDQSHENATWGNGEEEVTVAGGETVTGTIHTGMTTVAPGQVRITEHWANGSEDHDVVVVDYGSKDCTPVVPQLAFAASTAGAGGCETTTGNSFLDWSVTNSGTVGLRAVGTDLPGGALNTLIPPGETLDMPTVHAAGNYSVAAYSVDIRATDGRTATLHADVTPTLTGICTAVVPQTDTPVPPVASPTVLGDTETAPTLHAAVPTVQPAVAAATLPHTGSAEVPLTIAGFGLLGLGLLVLGTSNGAARLRRFGNVFTRVRAGR